MSGIVKWVIKLTMLLFVIISLLKQCFRPVIIVDGFIVTNVSMRRLCLKDTIFPTRVYYLVRFDGYKSYVMAYKAFYQGPTSPRWRTPLNDIGEIAILDSAQHDISNELCFDRGKFKIQSLNKPDTVICIWMEDKDLGERNYRMRNKRIDSVDDFVFWIDKGKVQPSEIRLSLDSRIVNDKVRIDTLIWNIVQRKILNKEDNI